MSKKHEMILLIDDDTVIDFLHKKLLIKAGITEPIITLYNGKVAIEKLAELNDQLNENDTVLALLDLNMPVLDGWGFLKELDALYSNLKFKLELYILSSSNNPDDIQKSKNNPYVKDYLNKPLSKENIMKYLV
jgi:CheY-like chemotaxis protein